MFITNVVSSSYKPIIILFISLQVKKGGRGTLSAENQWRKFKTTNILRYKGLEWKMENTGVMSSMQILLEAMILDFTLKTNNYNVFLCVFRYQVHNRRGYSILVSNIFSNKNQFTLPFLCIISTEITWDFHANTYINSALHFPKSIKRLRSERLAVRKSRLNSQISDVQIPHLHFKRF